MRFSLESLQALPLIEKNPPRIANGNFSAVNVRLMGQALFLMTIKMGDAVIDLANSAETIKKFGLVYTNNIMKKDGKRSLFFSASWFNSNIPTMREQRSI